jgi:thymidylate synthase (FAD)
MEVKLVAKTQIDEIYFEGLKQKAPQDFLNNVKNDGESFMAYVARVSTKNQTVPQYEKLLQYCIKESHWSVFEMIDVVFEIVTSRAIAQQIIRHRSFTFQEFSQRYSKADLGFEYIKARRQDLQNRQNSIDDMSKEDIEWFDKAQEAVEKKSLELYNEALEKGIAKEQARFLLPLNVRTRLYMKGSLRNWIHYVNLRSGNGTQKEHAEIAIAIRKELKKHYPVVAKACEW